MMKSQDILVLLKVAAHPGWQWTYGQLAAGTGISSSETHASVSRSKLAGLMRDGATSAVIVRATLVEFFAYGLRYVFPAEFVKITRGMPTAASAPALSDLSLMPPMLPIVWPHVAGTERGQGLAPIHDKMPTAALADPWLYRLLALADLVRAGTARERSLAIATFQESINA